MPNTNDSNSNPQAAIDDLVGSSSQISDLQSQVDAALATAQEAAQTAQEAAGNAGVPSTCAVTVLQTGKAGDDVFELSTNKTVQDALTAANKTSNGCTIKKQSNGGPFVRVSDPATSRLGPGSHVILVTPRVAGGRR